MKRAYRNIITICAGCFIMNTVSAQQAVADYPIQPVVFTQVHLTDDFWKPRLETNATVTKPNSTIW